MFNRLILIVGAPRSCTSWLGQIIDSHPKVSFRFQPLFSYLFKGYLKKNSKQSEYIDFLQSVYKTNDEYILQKEQIEKGTYPKFVKDEDRKILVIKNVRYHYLLPDFFKYISKIKVIAIVRNPCAVISSWINHPNPNEFPKDKDPIKQWRNGECRNSGPEEYFGFEKWKEANNLFLELKKKYPDKMEIIQYKKLVENTFIVTDKIFNFLNLRKTKQTNIFLKKCHSIHNEDPYAVFKNKIVRYKWIWELPQVISKEIISEIIGTKFEQFIA